MKMKTVNLGVIGAGRMGNAHAKVLAQIEGVKIAGVYDIKPEAAKAFCETYGAAIHQSAEELARNSAIDGLLVCSPTPCHPEGVEAAFSAKKAVFCEKPLCRNLKDAKKILKEGLETDHPFAVGFVRRYMAKTMELKRLLDAGTLGKIRFCNVDLPLGIYKRMPGDWFADFDSCGGVIIDMLAHHIDLANWFFGKPERVYAASLLLDKSQPEPADYAASIVTYKNGVICNFMANWQRFGRSGEMMEIYGDGGSLTMDSSDNLSYYPNGKEKQLLPAAGESGHRRQMKSFVAAILDGSTPTATLQDGFNSLEVALSMIESAKNGKAMRL